MITLYAYPGLFGLADNNGYGLKLFAFLKLAGIGFAQVHLLDASAAPRGQLPYIDDAGEMVGDSEAIIAYLTFKYRLNVDDGLTAVKHDTRHLVLRLLDDLYWVMSYSRWQDGAFWPAFRDALRCERPTLTEEVLLKARDFNLKRFHYQGIGRYPPAAAYARGVEDLRVLANLVPAAGYVFGPRPTSIDVCIYGFIANIVFSPIDTPLRQLTVSNPNLVRHCRELHAAIGAVP